MSATLKKLEEIQKRKLALQQEEDALRSTFITEFTEILSTLPLLSVDLDVLVGAVATAIDQAQHNNPAAKNDPQVNLWKERGIAELNRFRRQKRTTKQQQTSTKSLTKKAKTSSQPDQHSQETAAKN